ncbi:MAG TPA: patatin-like phospholipase family protein [Anaerolineales bacterium]|nr:patatin-like phospholipase family protein [Anaerolineales bacterium]HMS00674.1 patatin-like phospholipase family protein [Anaerolineales bacterium]HNQ95186.1 patatin-like phospholipase family protein [Anaerolineales bacterium]HNS60917.1 patatin-like phospholipase family protein [Anaerolineales bacterium]
MDISLALGGGGSKGNAHIGVLRRLDQHGFNIRAIAGTSFGALVSAFYALGYPPDEIEATFTSFDQNKIFGHAPEDEPSFMGIAGGAEWLEIRLGGKTFADLKIPCVLTAVDLNTGKEMLLSEGNLLDAVLASAAIPGIFPARRIGDMELVDGGTLDPVPVAPVRALAPNLPVVAVALNAPMGEPAQSWSLPRPKYVPQSIADRLSKMRYAQAIDVVLRSVDIMNRAVSEYRLEVDKPEILIRPAVSDVDTLEQVSISEIAKRGEKAFDDVLPELMSLFAWHKRLARTLNSWSQP